MSAQRFRGFMAAAWQHEAGSRRFRSGADSLSLPAAHGTRGSSSICIAALLAQHAPNDPSCRMPSVFLAHLSLTDGICVCLLVAFGELFLAELATTPVPHIEIRVAT